MKKLRLLILLLLVVAKAVVAQQFEISPVQSYIVVERWYPGGTNSYNTTLTVKDAAGTAVFNKITYSQFYTKDTIPVMEGQTMPQTLTVLNKYYYSYEQCDNYCCPVMARVGNSTPGSMPKGTNPKGRVAPTENPNCYTVSSWNTDFNTTINFTYPVQDTTFGIDNYLTCRVQVLPNLDQTFNLPSHEKIKIGVKTPGVTACTWEYQVGGTGGIWQPIPSTFYRNNAVELSGMDLFGSNYLNMLDKSVYIRCTGCNGSGASNIIVFTHRLSAPTILSVTPVNNTCYGGYSGSAVVRFSRSLLPGERLNLLLKDTTHYVDYSALNLTQSNLNSNNEYNWSGQLAAGKYFLSMIGRYTAADGSNSTTYTGSLHHYSYFTVTSPEKIHFYLELGRDVSCKGGNDGRINLYARGGSVGYKYLLQKTGSTTVSEVPFMYLKDENPNVNTPYLREVINNLSAGIYKISVRDLNGCAIRDSLGREIAVPIEIMEPATALALNLLETTPATSFVATDGTVKVNITGGTPDAEMQRYTFQWKDSATQVAVPNVQLDETQGRFQTYMNSLKPGVYILTAYDKAYQNGAAYNQTGCSLEVHVPIIKPDPLTVQVRAFQPVTCNGLNNGQLLAQPAGGHKIDSIRYRFKWYKGGSATVMGTDSLLTNATPGTYTVEVEDRYANKTTSSSFTLGQPTPLQVVLGTTHATCFTAANGSVSAVAVGGTAPYRYEWSTGQRQSVVSNLPGGPYIVVVTDTMGCNVTAQVNVTSPVQVLVNSVVTPVTCLGNADGKIQLSVSGGTTPYSYQWKTGSSGSSAQNLPAGRYWFDVRDAGGCLVTDTIDLDVPLPFTAKLEADHNICTGQNIQLVPAITGTAALSYAWSSTNGFSSSNATAFISQPGTYMLSVTNNRNCVVKDTIVLTPVNSAIATDYIVSSQAFAGENVVLINMSTPLVDSVQWILPVTNSIQLIQSSHSFCELRFSDTGRYEIGMKAFYNSGCIDGVKKSVLVVNKVAFGNMGTQGEAYLKRFVVSPNPNSGQFTVELLFNALTKARLRLINTLTNVTVNDRTVEGSLSYNLSYNYGGQLVAGTYVLIIETAKGSFVYKVIIQ